MDLIEQYKLKHEREPRYGAGACWHDEAGGFANRVKANSAIDWGCGKGGLVSFLRAHGIRCVGYDPAIPFFETLPTKAADLVTCLDVMEHLPEEEVLPTLRQIRQFARRGVFLNIATRPAMHKLPNGRNCHETVKPSAWWRARIVTVFSGWAVVFERETENKDYLIGLET